MEEWGGGDGGEEGQTFRISPMPPLKVFAAMVTFSAHIPLRMKQVEGPNHYLLWLICQQYCHVQLDTATSAVCFSTQGSDDDCLVSFAVNTSEEGTHRGDQGMELRQRFLQVMLHVLGCRLTY